MLIFWYIGLHKICYIDFNIFSVWFFFFLFLNVATRKIWITCVVDYISIGQHCLEVKSVGSGDTRHMDLNCGSTNHSCRTSGKSLNPVASKPSTETHFDILIVTILMWNHVLQYFLLYTHKYTYWKKNNKIIPHDLHSDISVPCLLLPPLPSFFCSFHTTFVMT